MRRYSFMPTQHYPTDKAGILMLVCAAIGTPAAVIYLPWYYFPVSLFGYWILNFGGHAALHESLFDTRPKGRKVLCELLMLAAYVPQCLHYHQISAAHMNHHVVGRHERFTVDVVEDTPRFLDYCNYYFKLLVAPYMFWFAHGAYHSFLRPGSKRFRSGRIVRNYIFPACLSGILVITFIAVAVVANPMHTLVYIVGSMLTFNMLQNVAHYGLKGATPKEHALAARTYIVGRLCRRLTYGALAHLPHHIFMHRPGQTLHTAQTLSEVAKHIDGRPAVYEGTLRYFAHVALQLRGPVARVNLSTDWKLPLAAES